jgi:hypothetical protein
VQAGPLASTITANAQVGATSIGITSPSSFSASVTLGPPPPPPGPQPQQVAVQVNGQVSALQARLSATIARAQDASGAKARALRAQARKLRRQATALAASVQQQAIAQASAAADGTYLVVNAAGTVVAQSGGITVTPTGVGTYDVSFDPSANPCFSSSSDSQLTVTGPNGPVNGGFFLAAAGC